MFAPITILAIVLSLVAAENSAISDVANNVFVFDVYAANYADNIILAVKNLSECENFCLNDSMCRSFALYSREENKTTSMDEIFNEKGETICYKNNLPFTSQIGFDKGRMTSTLLGYHNEPKVGIKKDDGSYEMYASTAIWYQLDPQILDTNSENMTVKQCSQRCTDNKDCIAFSYWTPFGTLAPLNTYLCELFGKYDIPPVALERYEMGSEPANYSSVTGNVAARKSDNCMKELETCLNTYQTCCRKVDLLTEMCPESCNGNACKTNFESCKSEVKDKSSKPATNDASVSASFGAAAIMGFLAAI